MTNTTIEGKSLKDYLEEKKKQYGVLYVKRGKQVVKVGDTKIENNFRDCDLILNGEDTLIFGEAFLEKNGKRVSLNGRIELKGGVWYENGNKVNI